MYNPYYSDHRGLRFFVLRLDDLLGTIYPRIFCLIVYVNNNRSSVPDDPL